MAATLSVRGFGARGPEFTIFWIAQAISRFGDPITLITLAYVTFKLTGSGLATGLAVLVATLPQATFGFVGGAVADALGLRRAMVTCDIARAILIAAVPPTIAAGLPLAVAFVLVLLAGLASTVYNPARLALIPALVPADQLVPANSAVYATDRSVEILGALAAGLLVATVGDSAFYIDAATFATSALLLTRVRPADDPRSGFALGRVVGEAASGLRFVRDSAVLRYNTIVSLLAQLSIPLFNALLPVFIFRHFVAYDASAGAQLFGIAEATLALGAVLTAAAMTRLRGRIAKGRLLLIGFVIYGAALFACALARSIEMLLATVFVIGVANVLFFISNMSIAQEATPAELRGRVFGARLSLLSLTWLPVMFVSGALADVVPVPTLIGVAGAFTFVVALVAAQFRIVRDVR